jgi:hypothetical protein
MATIEEALLAHIEANVPEAGKGFPLDVPQDEAYPAFAYQTIDDTRPLAHDGPLKLHKARVQITFIAANYGQAKGAANALSNSLDGYKGMMNGVSVQFCKTTASDDWADIHQLPVVRLDVMVNYK